MIEIEDAKALLRFLDRIEGHGYGGTSEFDLAHEAVRKSIAKGKTIGGVEQELLIAAKEAAVMLAEMAKAANVDWRGPGTLRLIAAIKAFEAKHGIYTALDEAKRKAP